VDYGRGGEITRQKYTRGTMPMEHPWTGRSWNETPRSTQVRSRTTKRSRTRDTWSDCWPPGIATRPYLPRCGRPSTRTLTKKSDLFRMDRYGPLRDHTKPLDKTDGPHLGETGRGTRYAKMASEAVGEGLRTVYQRGRRNDLIYTITGGFSRHYMRMGDSPRVV